MKDFNIEDLSPAVKEVRSVILRRIISVTRYSPKMIGMEFRSLARGPIGGAMADANPESYFSQR